jgi:UrcA family protein
MNFKTIVIAAVLAAAPLAATAETVAADPNKGAVSVRLRVPRADLDLSSMAGVRTMLQRLQSAASRACGGPPEPGPAMLSKSRAWDACRARSLGVAVAQLDAPQVSRAYAAADHARVALADR